MITPGRASTTECSLCHRLSHVVERGESWTLALNLNQNLLGKCMLVLNRHAEDVRELTSDEWSDLHRGIASATSSLDALFQPDTYNYAFLMNQDAHVHLHIVPRYSSARDWHGYPFDDPHWGSLFGTDRKLLPEDSMDALRRSLQARSTSA